MRATNRTARMIWTALVAALVLGVLPQTAPLEPAPLPVPATGVARAAETAAKVSAKGVYRVPRPVRGGQATIDRGRATLYYGPMPSATSEGTTWIAGHNYAGWAYWSKIPRGAKVVVTGAKGVKVAYRVVSRTYVGKQGGSSVGLVHDDLMLQTCKGSGTMFVYADRIG